MLKNLSKSPENAIISTSIITSKTCETIKAGNVDGAACLGAVRHRRRWRRPRTRPGSPPPGPSAGPSYRCLQHTVPLFSLHPPTWHPARIHTYCHQLSFLAFFNNSYAHIWKRGGDREGRGVRFTCKPYECLQTIILPIKSEFQKLSQHLFYEYDRSL
jgi:hypothetical protein